MWKKYFTASSLEEATYLLSEYGNRARILAGGTDLILELERGARQNIDVIVDISRIPNLDQITIDSDENIHIGPLVTHNIAAESHLLREKGFPLAKAAYEVGSPQIRNRGTIVGNLVTGSPANDTITPLICLGAKIDLLSTHGRRVVDLENFYTGVRKTVIQPDEILVDINFPSLKENQRGVYSKLGLRRTQAISVANIAVVLTLDNQLIKTGVITMGAVAPTIIHAREAEEYLSGKELTDDVIEYASNLASQSSQPITDIRGSANYRQYIVGVLVNRGLKFLRNDHWRMGIPNNPVSLSGIQSYHNEKRLPKKEINSLTHSEIHVIHTSINGKEYEFQNGQGKTLLHLLREDAGLTGTKEGCAEGECGSCTIFLNGKAVMACLIPAPCANEAEIITIEGLSSKEQLHNVQKAFIDVGAVQCGYCTPGLIMSGAKLLEEKPHPSFEEITLAFSGNLCRCTGYYKIIQAIERASQA